MYRVRKTNLIGSKMNERNTLKKSLFRFLIYQEKDGFIGICYETGFIDIWPTMEETKKHMEDSVIALLKTVADDKLPEKVLNSKPSIKYRLLFYFIPFWFSLRSFFRSFQSSFALEPFTPNELTYA